MRPTPRLRTVLLALAAALFFAVGLGLARPGIAAAQDDAEAADAAEPTRVVEEVEEGAPRYLGPIRAELERMRVRGATCEATDAQRAHCTFTARGITTGREFAVHLVYSDRTDTIYMYVERYLEAPPDAASTSLVLRRLMELNWYLLLGKFEWDATDGEVRLAMILNTDSNFDRRAFRSAVRGIGQLADRYYNELARVVGGQPAAAE